VSLYAKAVAWLSTPWAAENADRVFIQIGHVLGGAVIFLLAFVHGLPLWACAGLVEAWAVPKEFVFDYLVEDAAQRGSSPLDFSMYQVGLALAFLLR
jgi:hypothetical protein